MRLVDMKRLIPILCVTLSLVACSRPDSSGGVFLSKDPYPTNQEFPHGDCDDDPTFAETNTGCGWIHINDKSYYIKPGADLRGADLSGARLRGASLTGATLGNANLKFTELWDAILTGADFRYAYMRGGRLDRTDLREADLTGADLTDAWLSHANLTGAELRDAILERVGFRAAPYTICPNGKQWGDRGNDCNFR